MGIALHNRMPCHAMPCHAVPCCAVQVLAGLPDDQRAALLAAQAEGAMNLDEVDEVRHLQQPLAHTPRRFSCLPAWLSSTGLLSHNSSRIIIVNTH
jgi:hypothetical protein